MTPRRAVAQVAPPLLILGFCLGLLVPALAPAPDAGEKLSEIIEVAREKFHKELTEEELVEAAIAGIVEKKLDAWSQYFSAPEWKAFDTEHLKGRLSGVGIRV